MNKHLFYIFAVVFLSSILHGAEKKDTLYTPAMSAVDSAMKATPPFGIFKDNYIVTGSNFNGGINRYNTDVKYQISIMHRIGKGCSPKGRYVFVSYTQKSLWDVYQESAPFEDTNFNPSIGLGQHLIRGDKNIGLLLFQAEHESNGQNEGGDNRSWNMVSATCILNIHPQWSLQAKAWLPFWIADENKDIARYKGYWQVGASYYSPNGRWVLSTLLTKRGGWDIGMNINAEAAFKLGKNSNQYICVQYYNGYAESLLNYKSYSSYLRVGFVIKPFRWKSIM